MENIIKEIKNCKNSRLNLDFKRINDIESLIEYFNDNPIINYINLSNNRIKSIPYKIKELKYIKGIDLSGNLITLKKENIENLDLIDNLKELFINFNTEEEFEWIKNLLPNLEKLNNIEIKTNIEESLELENENSLDNISINKEEDFNKFSENFFNYFKKYINDLNLNDNLKNKWIENIKSHIEKISKENENILKKYEIHNKNKFIFKFKFGLIYFLIEIISKILSLTNSENIQKGLNYISVNLNYLFNQIFNNFNENIKEEKYFNLLKNNHNDIINDKLSLKEKYDNLVKENEFLIKKFEQEINYFKNEKENLLFEKESLEIENRQLIKKLINLNKKSVDEINIKVVKINNFKSLKLSQNNDVKCKNLNIKSTKKLIKNILKDKYLEIDNNKINDTMEEFLFKYLNNNYGLRKLIIENGNNIIELLKNNNDKSIELKIFGKLLRNEINYTFLKKFFQLRNKFESNIKNEFKISKLKNMIIPINKISTMIKFNINNKEDFNEFVKIIKNEIKNDGIDYKILLYNLIDFNLNRYENSIRFIVNKFKLIDIDNIGYINKSQLNNILSKDNISKNITENKISFNQFILFFN